MSEAALPTTTETAQGRGARPFRLPGLIPTLGFTWLYLATLVLVPLSWLMIRASSTSWSRFVEIIFASRTVSALRLSFGCAMVAAIINAVFGTIVAWVLARYEFPGRRILDGMVELPFALPTSVAGITLAFLCSQHGWFGAWFEAFGIRIAFTPYGIIVALTFVSLPFVVRTVQPLVQEMEREVEEAARSLGASPWSLFWRIQFPTLIPAVLTGFALALARAIGEYGSVLFISGNLPFRTEIVPLLIVTKLEQYDYEGAAVLASVMLSASLLLLACIHALERWTSRRFSGVEAGT